MIFRAVDGSTIKRVTEATKNKSVAMGSNTRSGIQRDQSGNAAAEVVRASNSNIEMSVAPDGATTGKKSE